MSNAGDGNKCDASVNDDSVIPEKESKLEVAAAVAALERCVAPYCGRQLYTAAAW